MRGGLWKEGEHFSGDESKRTAECEEVMGRRGSILAVMMVMGEKDARSSWKEEGGSRW